MSNKTAFQVSARDFGKSADKTWAMFVRTIADGIVEGIATYDEKAADGKGAWKKGSWKVLLDALLSEAGKTEDDGLPYVNASSASVTGECLRCFAPEILAEQDVKVRHELCDEFAKKYSKNACAELLKVDKEPKVESLAKIVADMYARAAKNGYSVQSIIDEVIAQGEQG